MLITGSFSASSTSQYASGRYAQATRTTKTTAPPAMAIGAPYPSWKLGKYHQFPSPPFIFYKTSVLKTLGLDWSPFPKAFSPQIYNFITRQIVRMGLFCTRRRLSKYPKLRKTAKRLETIFGVCAPDTGWLIASKSKRDNLKNFLLDRIIIIV